MRHLSRRAAILAGIGGGTALSLSGCAAMRDLPIFGTLIGEEWPLEGSGPVRTPDYGTIYGRLAGEPHPVPAFDFTMLDPAYLRADVAYGGLEGEGTIVVDPRRHQLFLVEAGGRATRYGVAVGPESRGFFGPASVAQRRAWPDWAPSPMVAGRVTARWAQLGGREPLRPDAPVPGGPKSPHGARALYLSSGGRDAGYVLHGTPGPWGIGTDVGQGCIGLINQDVIDLAGRTAEGARVIVLG